MRNDYESNYLAHHGILGMKWGHKNGPPYPLGASDHSAAEKKAGWRKSLGGGRNEERYVSKRKQKKNYSDSRIVDPDTNGRGTTGIKMKNGDRLFVSTDDVKKYGVDKAVEKTQEMIRQKTAEKNKKKLVDKEQKQLADEMLRNYDKKDPYAKEAKELLNEISKSNSIEKNVKDYEKKFNTWSNAQDKNDQAWEDVKEKRKAIGKTPLTRTLNAIFKADDPKVKEYAKAFNEWSDKQDILDAQWTNVKEAYSKTGKMWLSRVANNIRYGEPIIEKKKK